MNKTKPILKKKKSDGYTWTWELRWFFFGVHMEKIRGRSGSQILQTTAAAILNKTHPFFCFVLSWQQCPRSEGSLTSQTTKQECYMNSGVGWVCKFSRLNLELGMSDKGHKGVWCSVSLVVL